MAVIDLFKNREASLTITDGDKPLTTRVVKVLAMDDAGISYSWSFRGSDRVSYAPWASVSNLSIQLGSSKDHQEESWPKLTPKVKPPESGMAVVGRRCTVFARGTTDEYRFTEYTGYVFSVTAMYTAVTHNRFGSVYATVIGAQNIGSVEFKKSRPASSTPTPPSRP